jgi:hypothetical protein
VSAFCVTGERWDIALSLSQRSDMPVAVQIGDFVTFFRV